MERGFGVCGDLEEAMESENQGSLEEAMESVHHPKLSPVRVFQGTYVMQSLVFMSRSRGRRY